MPKADESAFNELHGLLTTEYTRRVKLKEECSTADLKAAAEWLIKNNVSGVASGGTPLKALLDGLTDGDRGFIERLTT